MDTSHLDLSRFANMTVIEFCNLDMDISPEEKKFAIILDSKLHLHRITEGAGAWNLWAYHFRDRFIEEWKGKEDQQNSKIFRTNKQVKHIDQTTNELHIENISCFINGIEEDNRIIVETEFVFNNFIFPALTTFNHLLFQNSITFDNAKFLSEVHFDNTIFNEFTSFKNTDFYGRAVFNSTKFTQLVTFQNSKFYSFAEFYAAQFLNGAYFYKTEMYGDANFRNSKFKSDASFEKAYFKNLADFRSIDFNKSFNIGKSAFMGSTIFSGSKFKGPANFDDCSFGSLYEVNIKDEPHNKKTKNAPTSFPKETVIDPVPNFIGAIFDTPPSFNYTNVASGSQLKWWEKLFKTPPTMTHKLIVAKFRRLKHLAKSNENHSEELSFFRQELLARRDNEVHGIQSNIIDLYEWVSKCGLSIKRPFIALIAFTTFFWVIYIALRIGINIEHITITPVKDLLIYSAHNALPLIGANSDQKLALVNKLFGGYDSRPIYFAIVSFIQNLIGLGLYFLILLAIRNYFRMR